MPLGRTANSQRDHEKGVLAYHIDDLVHKTATEDKFEKVEFMVRSSLRCVLEQFRPMYVNTRRPTFNEVRRSHRKAANARTVASVQSHGRVLAMALAPSLGEGA